MASFIDNLSKIETKFSKGMDLPAGKGIKIRTLFTAIKALDNGDVKNAKEMGEKFGFYPNQNEVYSVIKTMLESMGTPIPSGGKRKVEGAEFALELLKNEGLELPVPKKRS